MHDGWYVLLVLSIRFIIDQKDPVGIVKYIRLQFHDADKDNIAPLCMDCGIAISNMFESEEYTQLSILEAVDQIDTYIKNRNDSADYITDVNRFITNYHKLYNIDFEYLNDNDESKLIEKEDIQYIIKENPKLYNPIYTELSRDNMLLSNDIISPNTGLPDIHIYMKYILYMFEVRNYISDFIFRYCIDILLGINIAVILCFLANNQKFYKYFALIICNPITLYLARIGSYENLKKGIYLAPIALLIWTKKRYCPYKDKVQKKDVNMDPIQGNDYIWEHFYIILESLPAILAGISYFVIGFRSISILILIVYMNFVNKSFPEKLCIVFKSIFLYILAILFVSGLCINTFTSLMTKDGVTTAIDAGKRASNGQLSMPIIANNSEPWTNIVSMVKVVFENTYKSVFRRPGLQSLWCVGSMLYIRYSWLYENVFSFWMFLFTMPSYMYRRLMLGNENFEKHIIIYWFIMNLVSSPFLGILDIYIYMSIMYIYLDEVPFKTETWYCSLTAIIIGTLMPMFNVSQWMETGNSHSTIYISSLVSLWCGMGFLAIIFITMSLYDRLPVDDT